jgi:hypothetical protein
VSAVLLNLALVIGFFLFMLSMGIGLMRGVSFWTVVYRSAIVLSVGTVIVIAFFRYFNVVLFRFLAEKLEERRRQEKAEAALDGEDEE